MKQIKPLLQNINIFVFHRYLKEKDKEIYITNIREQFALVNYFLFRNLLKYISLFNIKIGYYNKRILNNRIKSKIKTQSMVIWNAPVNMSLIYTFK